MVVPVPMPARVFADERGTLTYGETGDGLPFVPRRYFIIYDVPAGQVRGGHAHRSCEQFLIAVSGRIVVTVDDGGSKAEHMLDRPDIGLHIAAGLWGEQRYLDAEARLLVLASEPYDPADYIAKYDEFLSFKADR